MAENFDNTPVAEATIPVKADLSEFTRAIDDALLELDRKLAAAADAAAKGFGDKLGATLDDIAQKLDALIVKADTMAAGGKQQQQQGGQSEQQQGGDGAGLVSDIRDIGRKVDDLVTNTGTIATVLDGIAARVGNS